ncbi:MAG: TonB-dependent receptor [Gammaproteobacteria bacterium]|nr:TonB-dependent receptor [Gammaproteobacteria bacterium]NNF48513.1 TonB-dependent receptor [Woeseiaceae bacterium]MBT8093627.1 TonB-dependent receptor [Gammaproteobacteria bacterium]MBT8106311.1 TonB-dependent receptor [Gammaproteobacteria bacterium]NNK26325.1 TonB-dependent receptor [Woeseiaceae bacterium]
MKFAIAFLAACCAALVPSCVIADDNPVEQLVVTAARTPLSINALGSAVTVITRDTIERRQARYVSDLLRTVPGFAVSQSGVAGSQTQVRVRGAEANHVLVLIDGARANDPATGDEFRWEFLSTANVERIEIVRGPQSAIWGSDALAGVVNIITRSGGTLLDAYVESGSRDTLNSGVNASIGDASWNIGIGIDRLATDGFNIARTGDERDDSDATTGSLNASLDLHESFGIRFAARTVDAWSQYDGIDFFDTGLPTDSDFALDTSQNYAQVATTLGATNARVRHHLGARYSDTDNRNIVDGIEDTRSLSDRLSLAYQADIRLGRDLLSLALERETTNFTQRGPVEFGDPNQQQEQDVSSAAAEFFGHVGDRVTWVASARYDDHEHFDDALTGRLSIAWNRTESHTLRAAIGTGHKNPTFIEMFGYFPGQFRSNPDLQPEESTSYEVGIEQRLADSLEMHLTVFRQDLENEIDGFVFDPQTFEFTAENLAGSSTREGVEASLHWLVYDALSINASYTYVDANSENIREVRRPLHSGSVDIDYGFLDGRARIALVADYGGTRTDTFFPPWPNPPETVILSNYWVVDLAARVQLTPQLALFGRVGNLLDTRYEQVLGYRTQGRAAYVGVRATFGDGAPN